MYNLETVLKYKSNIRFYKVYKPGPLFPKRNFNSLERHFLKLETQTGNNEEDIC